MLKKGSKKFWTLRRAKVRSGLEKRVKEDLESRGIDFEYETLKLSYTKQICQHCGEIVDTGIYTPDFIIKRDSGIRLVVEAKGYCDSATRVKMQRVKRDNPSEDIRIVFQRDQPIRKGSKTTYSQWSLKNGFPCTTDGKVPQEWINETEKETILKMSGEQIASVQKRRHSSVQRMEKEVSKTKSSRRKVHKR